MTRRVVKHEIEIEERAAGAVSAYRTTCNCKPWHGRWAGSAIAALAEIFSHLNDVEQVNAHDIVP